MVSLPGWPLQKDMGYVVENTLNVESLINPSFQGVVDIMTTGGVYEQLAGNAGSFFIAAIISMSTTYLFPDNFDFEITRRMNAFQPEDTDAQDTFDEEKVSDGNKTGVSVADVTLAKGDGAHAQNDASDAVLYKDFIFSVWLTFGLFALCVSILFLT